MKFTFCYQSYIQGVNFNSILYETLRPLQLHNSY